MTHRVRVGGCQMGVYQRGVLDLAENRSFLGSGRPRGALKPSKEVGGDAPQLSWMVSKPPGAAQTPKIQNPPLLNPPSGNRR